MINCRRSIAAPRRECDSGRCRAGRARSPRTAPPTVLLLVRRELAVLDGAEGGLGLPLALAVVHRAAERAVELLDVVQRLEGALAAVAAAADRLGRDQQAVVVLPRQGVRRVAVLLLEA